MANDFEAERRKRLERRLKEAAPEFVEAPNFLVQSENVPKDFVPGEIFASSPVSDNFFAGDPSKLTNPHARKLLGEAGFLYTENVARTTPQAIETITVWVRGTELLTLHESPNEPPKIRNQKGQLVDWRRLGVRNPQIMGDE